MPVEMRYSAAGRHVRADKPCSPSDMHRHSPGPCSPSPTEMRRITPEYNLSLSEMRHYKDEDAMVLILSQNNIPAEEAEYPIPIERDTSELLDADDDDTLAGYAEVASRLIKPSVLQLPDCDAHDSSDNEPPAQLFFNDDVSHEDFGGQTFEPSQEYLGHVNAPIKDPNEDISHTADGSNNGSPRGFFSSTEPFSEPVAWSESPVVHAQPWMSDDPNAAHTDGKHTDDKDTNSSPAQDTADRNGRIRAETSQMRGRAFSPRASRGSSSKPRVHNGSLVSRSTSVSSKHDTPRSHNGASQIPSTPSRVHNGASPGLESHDLHSSEVQRPGYAAGRRSRAARIKQRQAAREQKRVSADESQSMHARTAPEEKPSKGTTPFWPASTSEVRAHEPDEAAECRSSASFFGDAPGRGSSSSAVFFADRTQNGAAVPEQAHAPLDVEPFFAPPKPQVPESTAAPQEREAPELDAAYSAARFFESSQHFANVSAASKNGSADTSEAQHAAGVQSHEAASVTTADPSSAITNPDGSDPRKGSHKEIEQDGNASRSFARAVTHSILPSALPDYSTRRSKGPPRNSAMRRSSRRDAHMQQRIANLDTSDLSHYSLPTLRRLAKDMALTNFSRLSKSELVVQLVAEIILANVALGWSVPDVAHGHMHGTEAGGGDSSAAEGGGLPGTIYKFSAAGGGDSGEERDTGVVEVEVEDEVSEDKMQRGRGALERLKEWLPTLGGGNSEQREAQVSSTDRMSAGEVAERAEGVMGGVNVDEDFESLAKLSMAQLQELCEDLGVERWQSMRKYEMVGSLLMHVYGCQ